MANAYVLTGGQFVKVGPLGTPIDPNEPPPSGGPIAKPNELSTGPRTTVTGSTLSSSAAKAAAAANGGVLQGRAIANLVLSTPTDYQYRWLDCDITGAFYGVDAWFGQGSPPVNGTQRATFEHCFIHDCSADGMAGRNLTVRYCEFARNGDNMKPGQNTEVFGSLLHHLWAANPDAHGDTMQCFGGDDILIHWNTIIGTNAPNSPHQANQVASSALQMSTGSPVSRFFYLDNWVDGGAYTLRGADAWGGMAAHLVFRRNKHGRNYGFGPITGMGSYNGGLAVSDYDSSNVWEDTGLPVLG